MLEGSVEFEVAGHARDGEEAVVVWAARTDCWMTSDGDCFGDLQRVRTAAKDLRIKLGDDTDHPAYTFIAPSVGYRMPKGEKQGE